MIEETVFETNDRGRELKGWTAFFGAHRISLLAALFLLVFWRLLGVWDRGMGPEVIAAGTLVRLYVILISMTVVNYFLDLFASGYGRMTELRKYTDLRRVLFAISADLAMFLLIVLLAFFMMPYFNYTP